MACAAIMHFVGSVCFCTRKSDVTIRAISINLMNLLLQLKTTRNTLHLLMIMNFSEFCWLALVVLSVFVGRAA